MTAADSPKAQTEQLSELKVRRSELLRVQALLSVVLGYQMLFSRDSLASADLQQGLSLVLMLSLAVLALLPFRMWGQWWSLAGLVMADTLLTSWMMYLSGNADSDTYLGYFLIIILAATIPSLKQMMSLAVLICVGYGAVVWVKALEAGTLSEGYLLRIPFLLTMAIFYGVTADMARRERQEKMSLSEALTALRQTHQEREGLIVQLQEAMMRVKTLRGMLPICSSCKKIRDDKGYWNQVEEYLRDHTEAEFSHGICPDCATNIYGRQF